jgi:hypothetical protein
MDDSVSYSRLSHPGANNENEGERFSQMLSPLREYPRGKKFTRHLRQPISTANMRRKERFHQRPCCEATTPLEAVGYPAAGDDAHPLATVMTATSQSGLSK